MESLYLLHSFKVHLFKDAAEMWSHRDGRGADCVQWHRESHFRRTWVSDHSWCPEASACAPLPPLLPGPEYAVLLPTRVSRTSVCFWAQEVPFDPETWSNQALEPLLLIVSCAFSVLCFVTGSDHHWYLQLSLTSHGHPLGKGPSEPASITSLYILKELLSYSHWKRAYCLGTDWLCLRNSRADPVSSRAPGWSFSSPGQSMRFYVPREHCHVFSVGCFTAILLD